MDFILSLPKKPIHIDSVMAIVDRLSKMAYFISCKKIVDANHVA